MVNSFKNAKAKEQVWQSYQQLVDQWPIPLEELDLPTTYGLTHCILTGQKSNPPYFYFMALVITRRSCGSLTSRNYRGIFTASLLILWADPEKAFLMRTLINKSLSRWNGLMK